MSYMSVSRSRMLIVIIMAGMCKAWKEMVATSYIVPAQSQHYDILYLIM